MALDADRCTGQDSGRMLDRMAASHRTATELTGSEAAIIEQTYLDMSRLASQTAETRLVFPHAKSGLS